MRRLAPSLAALALLGAACGKPTLKSTSGELAPCSSDSQCQNGEVCLEVGCAQIESGLAVQVVPSSRSGLLTQEFGSVDLKQGQLDLVLGAAGGFTFSSNVVPFDVSLTGHSLVIPDVAESAQGVITGAETTLLVPPGSYTVVANPTDGDSPPTVGTAELTKPGATPTIPLKFFKREELVNLQGHLSSSLLGTPASPNTALTFDVQAFGAGLNSVPLSRSTSSTANNGFFTFGVWVAPPAPGTGASITLVVSPTAGIGPRVTFSRPFATLQQESAAGGITLNLGDDLHIEPVTGQVLDEAGQPVAGAAVTLDGTGPESAQGSFSFHSAPVTTGAAGDFVIPALFDAARLIQYSAVVVPPQGSHLAAVRVPPQPVPLSPGGQRVFPEFRVLRAAVVSGRVLDDKGAPVLNATVRAEPANATADVPLAAVETTTDAAGTFSLELTPGTYHFTFKPPFELNLPFNARTFAVGGSMGLPDFAFSGARIISGTVRGPDNSAVEGAVVRVYRLAQPGDDTPAPRSTLLATGKVVTGGTFSLTLPRPRK